MRPSPPPVEFRPGHAPEPAEIIPVHEHRVSCDGGGGALGHPRVYMEMGAQGFVECGYCDRRFVLAGPTRPEAEDADPGAYGAPEGVTSPQVTRP